MIEREGLIRNEIEKNKNPINYNNRNHRPYGNYVINGQNNSNNQYGAQNPNRNSTQNHFRYPNTSSQTKGSNSFRNNNSGYFRPNNNAGYNQNNNIPMEVEHFQHGVENVSGQEQVNFHILAHSRHFQ